MPTASTKAQTEAKGSPSSIDLVQVRDVLMSLAQKQTHQSMVDVTMSVLSQASKAIDELTHENAQLKKALFGRRSEKVDPGQLSLFAQVLSTVVAADKADSQPSTPDTTDTPQSQPKRKGGKRRPLRPTQRHEIKVSDKQRPCPQCGQPRCTIGHVRSVVVEYTPAKIEVIEYLREKVACRPCQAEVTLAPGPAQRLIDGASPGPQMLAALTVNKAVDGLPLNRTQKRFARSGVDLPIQTLNRWEGFAHQLLLPLIERLRTHVQQADTINLDDTGLRVLQAKKKGGSFKGHIWVFVARRYDPGGDLQKTQELVFYTYAKTWEAHHPEQFLAGCTAVLQGDAYRGYERIASEYRGDAIGKLLAGCCMHARRPFIQALDAEDPAASYFVERFQTLYRIEATAKADNLTADGRLALRKQHSVPVLQQMHERAQALSLLPLCKPMKIGVTYLLIQYSKLIVPFTEDGRLEIDNGSAERHLRRVASGRKAWLFAGSESGANRFAGTLSLVSSAQAAGLDPGTYIADVLTKISHWPNKRLDDLLPHRYKALCQQAA
jgi:transposase